MKRFWSFALAMCMIFSLMPMTVFAEEVAADEENGENISLSEQAAEPKETTPAESEESVHEHSYTAEVTAPTCTEKGYTTYTCECGDSYIADETEAMGHKWDSGKVTSMATTSAAGKMVYTCTECGKTKVESIAKSKALAKPVISSLSMTATGVKVKWNSVKGAEKYRVWYKEGSGEWVKAGDTSSTSFTVKNLTSNKQYTFRVRCVNSKLTAYTSSYSKTSNSILFIAAPQINSIYNVTKGIKMKWNAVDGAEKYRVFYKNDAGKWVKLADTTNTYYTAKNLIPGESYKFTVRCVSKDGKTNMSYYNTAGTNFTYVVMPKINSIYNVSKGIKMKWNAVESAEKYYVLRLNESGSWVKIGETANTYYKDNGLTANNEYTYSVRAVDADGTKSYYDKTGASFVFLPPPKLKSVSAGTKGVVVKWSAVDGAEKYRVMYKNESGKWVTAGETTGTSYTAKHLTSGKDYTLTVRCISSDGKVKTSYYNEKGLSLYYIAAPNVTLKNSVKGIQIKWGAVGGVDKYRILQKNAAGEWETLVDTADTSYQINKPTLGQEYTYTVVGINDSGEYISPYNTNGISTVFYYARIFLSPSSQSANLYTGFDTTEQIQCRRIADALEEDLLRCGFGVNNCQTGDYPDRAEESNIWGADLHVPLHTNAYNGKVAGTRIYVNSTSGEDYKCALKVYNYLAPLSPGTSDNLTENPALYEIGHTNAPTVYVESEFHDSKSTAKWIINHVDDIAVAICKGICDYYGVKYVA